ncbi:MAG: PAS domain S-box protein [Syntrophaceae bacterium]|nr:PAS domain S-box protein [Syntrophaceae bacterium]
MVVKKKSGLKEPKRVRKPGNTAGKSPSLQKRDSEDLGKTFHEQWESASKMKKEKVEERIDRLASFPELDPNPIVELDLKGHVQYLNPSAKKLFPDLRSKGSDHPWIADFESLTLLVNRDPKKAHLREKRIGDSWYQQVIYYTPEWKRVHIYGYDITNQKQSEDLISQGEEHYRKLFEDDLTGDFFATPEGVILDCNPSFIKIFGFRSKEEALNTNFFDLYPSHEEREIFMNRLRGKRKLEFYESALLKRDGTLINVIENIVGHFDEQGNLKQFKGYLFDNTEHKRAEDELKESEKKYRELYEGSQDGYVHVDMDGNIKEFNSAFIEMLEYSEEELKRLTYIDLTPKKWHSMEAEIIKGQVLVRGYSDVYEKEYIKKNGTIFPISLRTYLIKDINGNPDGMWAFIRDISKRKEIEEAIRNARDELENQVRERTAELSKANEELEREIVERKRVERTLVEQGRILEAFFTSTITPLVLLDKDFNFIRVNEAYAKVCQRQVAEFPGHNHFEFYPSDIKTIFEEVIKTKEPYQAIAHPFVFPDHREWGETYWDWTLTPLLDDNGGVEFLVFSLEDVTERKRAEEAVKAERERFNNVLEMLPAYLVLLTPDYHVPFANRFFRERFGESQGRRCFEYLFGRSEPCEICETYTVLKTGAPHQWEWTGPDGRIYDVFDFPFTNTDGSILILEMGIDITERKRVEEQFRAASLYAKSLIEASLDPLVTISRDGKIMDVNRATELVTGVRREQLIGSDFSDYFTEPEKAKEGYEKVFSEGFVTDYPLAIRNISGKVIEVLYNAAVYKNEHGEVQGVFAAARDVTERKQAEDSLREREALLRTVFETLPVGVWITDKEGRIIRGNPAGQQIWAGARYVGIDQFGEYKGWRVDTGKRIEPEEWAAARAVLKGETSINEEIEIECFDGSHKIILNSAVPIRDERQEILGAFIVNQDITERKRTEKAIRQMQKMEALGTLAGGIAHDFNNILMPIVINTELALLDTPYGSPISNYLKLIQEAANRGKDLIKQIITFSRQKEQLKAPIQIGPVIKEALKFLRSSIPKNIEIRECIEVAPSVILADPTQIHQVLMNLGNNAAYAMREKGGVLNISLTPVEVDADMVNRHLDLKPGPYLRLTVADTGLGMDKEIMEKIFDPFFTTKKPGEGAGMGLAVVHGIVKNHGGAITVYSEVGKGSTFSIFLPIIKEELETEPASPEMITMGKERILLIDDEEIQIRSVQPMLERLGYRVIVKADAIEALDIFRLQPNEFDLVITDQTMPRMTGRELAEEILRIRPDIPIILCTGFSEVIHEEEAKLMGIREFIMKPFSMNEMAGIIRKSLERNG